MHREYLAKLPAVWAAAHSMEKLQSIPVSYTKIQVENGVKLSLQEAVGGEEISYVGISIKGGTKDERMTLEFGEHRFTFDSWGDVYLIPVSSSPYWKWQDRIEELFLKGAFEIRAEDVEVTFYR